MSIIGPTERVYQADAAWPGSAEGRPTDRRCAILRAVTRKEPPMDATCTAVFEEADGWIVGWMEELPGAISQERTLAEARERLREAAQLILEARREIAPRSDRPRVRESITVTTV